MAKPLLLEYAGRQIPFDLTKVAREKLYGYKETEAVDDHDRRCTLATLADDGRTLVGRGGVSFAYLTAERHWRDKSQLKPVDVQGEELAPHPSSFSAPIPLDERVSTDFYLEHNIRAVYHLTTAADAADLREELDGGAIFHFPFSYRGGLDPDAGFLLTNSEGDLFLTLGKPCVLRYLGLGEMALAAEEGDEQEEEEDSLDFEMM
jgi:hypothetical protein